MMRGGSISLALAGLALAAGAYAQEGASPPEHSEAFPNLGSGESREEIIESYELAPQLGRGEPARVLLEQQRRFAAALDTLAPQRAGTVDAYVLSVALDSDPVFAREAREAGRVLGARYDAAGRTLVLAGPDGTRDDRPRGSVESLIVAIAHLAELMDPAEDVLVLYTTSHGNPLGLAYHYGDTGYGVLSPARLAGVLEEVGIARRLLIVNACYAGVFVPHLASADTAILTAAAATRNSFGCEPQNDWTFYGDALINRAMRQPLPLAEVARAAGRTIAGWEAGKRLPASLPQSDIGEGVSAWLPALEARMPAGVSEPVGRPAVDD